MADSNSIHEVPLYAAPEQRIDTDLQETKPVNENDKAQTPADENHPVFLSHADENYTTVPTSDAHSLACCKEPAFNAPGTEKAKLPPQKPKERLVVLRSWLFELLALLIGVLSFSGIITILVVFNGQAQLEFARDININTVIAILSTTLRTAMTFIATEDIQVIGQSKWGWLETSRPLRHVERLDNAGRGAWGSIKFLLLVSKPNFAVIGALLMITSSVIDPFSQQIAKPYSCNIPSEAEASIYVARRVSWYHALERPLMPLTAMTGLLGLTLGYDAAETSKSQLFQCPSGNCTFPSKSHITHTSVGICSSCIDMTPDLVEKSLGNQKTTYEFPQQPFLQLTRPSNQFDPSYFIMESNYDQMDLFQDATNLLRTSTTSIIAFSTAACRNHSEASRIYKAAKCRKLSYDVETDEWKNDKHVGIVAVDCSLFPCLRRYSGEVSLGRLKEKLVSQEVMDPVMMIESLDYIDYRADRWWFIKFEPCGFRGKWYGSSNITNAPEDSEWVSWRDGKNTTHKAPKQCVLGFAGQVSALIADFHRTNIYGEAKYSAVAAGSESWLPALAAKGNITFESISASFESMAAGYTKFMRGDWEEIQNERFNVVGTAYKSAVCIRADWPWLVYPGVLLVSTTILLIAACAHSMRERNKRPVWKSTILPFLFYNFKMNRDEDQDPTDEDRMEVPLLQLKKLETLADKTVARFSADAAAPGFIVENDGNSSGGASTGQQVGLLRRVFKSRAD